MLQQPPRKAIKYGVLMLILSCDLDSLLFLRKNDIINQMIVRDFIVSFLLLVVF